VKYISISRGPQFRDGKPVFAFFIFLALLIISISFIIEGDYVVVAFLSVFIILLLFYILDIQGIDIDIKKSLYRSYKLYLWGKRGKWEDYSSFKSVKIDFEIYYVKTAKFYSYYSGTSNFSGKERHDRYLIMLSSDDKKNKLLVAERIEYKNAIKKAKEISRLLNLPMEDLTTSIKPRRINRRVV
jgi:hypothetical protein